MAAKRGPGRPRNIWQLTRNPRERSGILLADGSYVVRLPFQVSVDPTREVFLTLTPEEAQGLAAELAIYAVRANSANTRRAHKPVRKPRRTEPKWPKCSSCGGRCNWAEDAWVCVSCGDEWYPDHAPEYAAPGGDL